MKTLRTPDDFTVQQCVVHFYQGDDKRKRRWLWYCITDDTGSGRRPKRRNGHARKEHAQEGALDHAMAKYRNRQQHAWLAWWWRELMTTEDPEFFVALWRQRNSDIGANIEPGALMAAVQSDEGFRDSMRRINCGCGNPLHTVAQRVATT